MLRLSNKPLNIDNTKIEVEDGVLKWINSSLKHLDVPYGVIEINMLHVYDSCDLESIIVPKTVKLIDYFYKCYNLKNVYLTDGLEEISNSAFSCCKNLESIIIPKTVKKLGGFSDCNNLKNITLFDGLKEIKSYAFQDCISLESITIPKTVKTIENSAFDRCFSLKNITLFDGLEIIGRDSFRYCEALESIIIPKTVTDIESGTFSRCCSLKNITLQEGLKNIGLRAFNNCESLEKIIFPKTIKYINTFVFDGCKSLKDITFKYKNYEELKELINHNMGLFCSDGGLRALSRHSMKKSINLIFEGPALTPEQQNNISSLIDDKNIKIIFESKYDDDIQILLDKINNTCTMLPDNIKNKITIKVNNLLKAYQQNLVNLKPIYNEDDDILAQIDLNLDRDIKFLKPELLADLEMIILNLSSADNSIKFLEELNRYKNLLKSNVDNLSTEDSIEGNIKNIIYTANKLDKDKSIEILDILTKYIDDTINSISLELNNLFKENNNILSNYLNYVERFKLNISTLYDEVNSRYKKLIPINSLLNSLNSPKEDINDGNTLQDIISSTKYYISEISNDKYREELEKQLNELIEKYTIILNNIKNDKELLNNTNFKDIEINIIKDLHQLLHKLNDYAYLDDYETSVANKTNIKNQLLEAHDLLLDNNIKELTEEDKLKAITSYVMEIKNEILSSDLIDEDNKIKMKNNLLQKIFKIDKLLKEKSINSIDDYNQFLIEVFYILSEVELKIYFYIKNMETYGKYAK